MLCSLRRLLAYFVSLLVLSVAVSAPANAQTASRNVNMVSGTQWPNGDPFLQRQNEPSLAVSTRNPLHLLAGANDYRTVDLPGFTDGKVTGDAWLGIFKSRDGGLRWNSTLLPGYPQDNSSEGLASPLKGLTSAADPIVRGGTNGLFFFGGIAFNRDQATAPNKLFVARFIDKNNRENGDTVKYLNTVAVQTTAPGDFADKPWLATDIPRSGAPTCSVDGESFKGGNTYLIWTLFSNSETQGKIMFSRSTNCGAAWSTPLTLSTGQTLPQGATIAVSPLTGWVYVAWRRFASGTQTDAIFAARSTNGGASFGAPVQVASLPANNLFDQGTTSASFRTNSYPTMTIDLLGRVYLAWSQRGVGTGGDARVVLTTSLLGTSWTTPAPVENHTARGHQVMPSLTMSALKLMIAYYDLREDSTVGIYQRAESGEFVETRQPVGDLIGPTPNPLKVFTNLIMDAPPAPITEPIKRRHTMDVRFAQANPAATPTFSPSVKVTQYDYGSKPGSNVVEQLEFNAPNLPMFRLGSAAFFGDYIDLVASLISPSLSGSWTTGDLSLAGGAHVVWTDNRNVQPPPPGKTWADYTPPISVFAPLGSTSIFDPTQTRPPCGVETPGFTTAGMRNQNIYTARITQGLYVGLLGNTKPLSSLQRAFAMFAQNNLSTTKHYRLTITNQPTGGKASFLQSGTALTSLDVSIAAYSSVARSVFVTSTNAKAKVLVLVREITAIGGTLVNGGQQSGVLLNPDSDNPPLLEPENPTPGNPTIATAESYSVSISKPEIRNPEIANPEIANPEIANPEIANPEIANPEIANPEIANPEIANPEIANPEIANPEIANPEIANPEIANPEIANPEIANGSMTDASWTITNTGNTSATYNLKLLTTQPAPAGAKFQLLVYWTYTTPVAKNCTLTQETNYVLQANVINPEFVTNPATLVNSVQDTTNPSIKNVTIALEPGQIAKVTLRMIAPSKTEVVNFLTTSVKPATVAQAASTGTPTPQVTIAALGVATSLLPAGVTSGAYSADLMASGGTTPHTWSLDSGTLPAGLTLNAAGVISGTPTVAGVSTFTVKVVSADAQTAARTLSIQIKATATASLSFIAQPTNTVLSQNLSSPDGVQVQALAGSDPVPGLNITLAIGTNPSGGTLVGFVTAATNASGIATFSNLRVSVTGNGYTLVAAASGVAQITSTPFDIAAPPGASLSFVQGPPSSSIAGVAMPTDTRVRAVDSLSAGLAGVSVTIDFGANPSSAVLSGTLIKITDATGIATFSGLSVSRGGYDYRFRAYGGGIPTTTSNNFNVEGFTPTAGDLVQDRSAPTATRLGNGKVLLTGGAIGAGAPFASAELYDPAPDTFTATGSMSIGRIYHTATLLPNGKVLIVGGGIASGDTTASVELYDPATGAFTLTGSMGVTRRNHTATLLPNGKVLIAGGVEVIIGVGGFYLNSAELYDPAPGTFSPTGSLSIARERHTATLLPNGKVLLASGFVSAGAVSELYDPATGTFSSTGVPSQQRFGHTATLLPNGNVLLAGGAGPGVLSALSSAETYNPVTGVFSITGSMTSPRSLQSATLLPNGKVLLSGGYSCTGTPLCPFPVIADSADIYDPTTGTGTFSATANMSGPRAAHTATLLGNGKILIAGGNTIAGPGKSAELFLPLDPPFSTVAFNPTGSLGTARNYPSATRLGNGTVLLTGGFADGFGGTPAVLNTAELHNGVSVTLLPNLGGPRVHQSATLLANGKVLIAGGQSTASGGSELATAELYNPVTATFSPTGSMSVTRTSHTATLLPNGKVLIAGGAGPFPLASAELYDPATGAFSLTGSMSIAHSSLSATLLPNGKVLIAGGLSPDFLTVTNVAELYDPGTGTFSLTGSLSTPHYAHTATLLPNGKVLIASGFTDLSLLTIVTTAELYDPVGGTFTLTGSLGAARAGHTATLLANGKALLAGGVNALPFDGLTSAELFDPATGSFSFTSSLTVGRQAHTATLLPNGKVLLTSGLTFNAGPALSSAELYSPDQ